MASEGRSEPAARHVLVPLTLAELGESKLPVSVVQARAYGASIMLLHVIDRARRDQTEVDAAEAKARAYLEMVAAGLRSDGLDVHLLVRYGPVARTILAEIRARETDLVILGTDVRPGIVKGLLGSVANEVVAGSPCPVMLVKPYPGQMGQSGSVRTFAEDLHRTGPVSSYDLGVRMVDPARIIGSVARAEDLAGDFRPRNPNRSERERYERIREAMRQGETLPPVILFKLGYGYYVLEGHRRVAAARQLGLTEIAAEVRDFVPAADELRRRVFAERREFEAATGLTRIAVALPGHYARLRGMIGEFAKQEGLADLQEAAQRWERMVYSPGARMIRGSGWRQHFPDLRTADIFLLLSDSLERLTRQEGSNADWKEALASLLAEEARSPVEDPPSRGVLGAIKNVRRG